MRSIVSSDPLNQQYAGDHGSQGSLLDNTLPYRLVARVDMPEPLICIRFLANHLREDAVDIRDTECGFTIVTPLIRGSARHEGNTVVFDVTASDMESLFFVRTWLHAHLSDIAGSTALRIDWSGNYRELSVPPSFSILTVVGAIYITPRIIRITFRADDISRFETLDALHVQLMVNFDDFVVQLEKPDTGHTFMPVWRRYTVRSVDRSRGILNIDVFLHRKNGPGSDWARAARPGDSIGVAGPSGGGLTPADWYLFAGDETALPAIARMLEALPVTAMATALLLVSDRTERQTIAAPHSAHVEWLYRDECDDGEHIFLTAIRRIDFPHRGTRKIVWAGCEIQTAKAIRRFLLDQQLCSKEEQFVVGYWHHSAHCLDIHR